MAIQTSIDNKSQSLTTNTFVSAGTTVTAGTGLVATTGGVAATGNSSISSGTFTVASGTNAINISADAAATTVNLATGAGVKTTVLGSTNSTSSTTVACGTGGANFGTSANAHATVLGSTTAASTTTIQAPSAGVILTGVQGVAVSNKNYVTINTATGAIGSDAAPLTSVSITGDTGGALTGSSFTFTGGTTGLSFGGSGSTETLTFAGITANGGTVSLATDATTSTINVGTGGGVKTSTFGSTNTTSATTVQSGSGALNVTSTNGALTVNSGTGALSVSNDAANTTLTIGTGGGVKTITLGSTNTTSVTTVACGTGGANFGTSANAHATVLGSTTASATTTIQGPSAGVFAVGVAGVTPSNKNMVTINTSTGQLGSEAVPSGTGDVTAASNLTDNAVVRGDGGAKGVQTSTVLISDAGQMTNPSQPAFGANLGGNDANVTGDGTTFTIGSGNAWVENFDQSNDFNTNGTFTAPVTGKYQFNCAILMQDVLATSLTSILVTTSNFGFFIGNNGTSFTGNMVMTVSVFADMDAADTTIFQVKVEGGTKTVDVFGGRTVFSGFLVC